MKKFVLELEFDEDATADFCHQCPCLVDDAEYGLYEFCGAENITSDFPKCINNCPLKEVL